MNLKKEVLIDPEKNSNLIFDEEEKESLLSQHKKRDFPFLVLNRRIERLIIPPRSICLFYLSFALYSPPLYCICIPIIYY